MSFRYEFQPLNLAISFLSGLGHEFAYGLDPNFQTLMGKIKANAKGLKLNVTSNIFWEAQEILKLCHCILGTPSLIWF
jgi:hypothetical protein